MICGWPFRMTHLLSGHGFDQWSMRSSRHLSLGLVAEESTPMVRRVRGQGHALEQLFGIMQIKVSTLAICLVVSDTERAATPIKNLDTKVCSD